MTNISGAYRLSHEKGENEESVRERFRRVLLHVLIRQREELLFEEIKDNERV